MLFFASLMTIASADNGVDVIEVAVPLATEDTQEELSEEQALQLALIQAINQITHQEYTPEDSQVKPFLSRIEHYLVAFETTDDESGAAVLKARFDGVPLKQEIGMSELTDDAVVPQPIVLWLAYEPKKGAPLSLLSRRQRDTVQAAVRALGRQQGEQLILPFMDQRDRDRVTPETVITGADEILRSASERYHAARFLFGILAFDQGIWTATLEPSDGNGYLAIGESEKPAHALSQALLSALSAATQASAEKPLTARVSVAQVKSWADYQRVDHHLSSLPGVVASKALRNEGDSAQFELRLREPAETWIKSMHADELLERAEGPLAGGQGDAQFYFYLKASTRPAAVRDDRPTNPSAEAHGAD